MTLYCYPKFVRSSGIGNRLFPWARSVLFAERHKAQMLPPRWVSLRRGPLLRGGRLGGGVPLAHVAGKLLLIGNFAPVPLTQRILRARLLARGRIVPEAEFDETEFGSGNENHETIVQFEQYGAMFSDVKGQSGLLLRRLREIVRPDILSAVDAASIAPIVLNVRGASDFALARAPSDLIGMGGVQTPIAWFRAALQRLRDASASDIPAIVVSDVADSALADLLSLKNVVRCHTRYALQDLLTLSRAKVIIGSGGSSFTAWGAYLAQAHVITVQGQSLKWFNLDSATDACVAAWSLDAAEAPHVDRIADAIHAATEQGPSSRPL